MNFDIKEFISATMILFAIIDIVGNIPLIVLFREKFKVIESEKASLSIPYNYDRILIYW